MDVFEEKKSFKLLERYKKVALKAIEKYPFLDNGKIQLLSYTENSIYLVESQDRKNYVLRVCRPNYHTKIEIESEVYWINSLNSQSLVEVAAPIATSEENFVQTIRLDDDKNNYYCVLFTFLEGETLSNNKDVELKKHFLNLGEITAHLHIDGQNRSIDEKIVRSSWDVKSILGKDPKWGKWQDGPAITPDRFKLFEKVSNTIQERLDSFDKSSERFGLIHSDLRLDNILLDNGQYKVLDFDDCGYGWYLFDLAVTFNSIEYKSSLSSKLDLSSSDLIHNWLEGYRKVRHLSKEEELEIPTFIMLRRLMSIGWMGSRNNKKTREIGKTYTRNTVRLANEYLKIMG